MDVKGSVTYRLICGGTTGQLWGLPSSHGMWEAVVGSNWSVKRFLEKNGKVDFFSSDTEILHSFYPIQLQDYNHFQINYCV